MSIQAGSALAARLGLVSTVLLILLLLIINLARPGFNVLFLLVQLLPLLLTLPGQFRATPRTYQWLCFAVLFYLTQGILLAFTPGWLLAGVAETLICLAIFVSAIIFIRTAIKAARQQASP
jgi:uncharacterized membrane protein